MAVTCLVRADSLAGRMVGMPLVRLGWSGFVLDIQVRSSLRGSTLRSFARSLGILGAR